MRAAQRKRLTALIGKKIVWHDRPRDDGWIRFTWEEGTLQKIAGNNLLIDGNWYWEPDMYEIQEKVADV